MYILIVKILPLLIGIIIAYAIVCIGKRKQIGFKWSLYLGLLHPIFALIIVLFSKKKDTPFKKANIFWKILAIILGIYGFLGITGGLTTKEETSISRDILYERQKEIPPVNTGNKSFDLILNDLSKTLGSTLGGGILSLTQSAEVLSGNDYRRKKYNLLYYGLLFISMACYILRQGNQDFQMKKDGYSVDTNPQKDDGSNISIG